MDDRKRPKPAGSALDMQFVEQALFTSIGTEGAMEYQVVAKSFGVCEADAREIAVWGPRRDSMLELDPDAESFNFHPLPSGAYCISRTTPAGWEHGGGIQRVFTHCLIVPLEVLGRFGNNPFAVIEAATANCVWQDSHQPSSRLRPFSLSGGAAAVDQPLLERLAVDPDPENMAAMVQEACNSVCLVVMGTPSPARLIAGLFSCFPVECRLEFSFSTGLKFSPRRPFRIVCLSDDPAEELWAAGHSNVTILKLRKGETPRSASFDGWAQLIERSLATGHISLLAAQISEQHGHLALDDLPALGLQWLEETDAEELRGDQGSKKTRAVHPSSAQRAHAAHRQFTKSAEVTPAATVSAASCSVDLDSHQPEVLEKLERLDDLVYEAISGKSGALGQLQAAWPEIFGDLGADLLAESREQYLRYALSVWEQCADANGTRDPLCAIHALDVICLLFSDTA